MGLVRDFPVTSDFFNSALPIGTNPHSQCSSVHSAAAIAVENYQNARRVTRERAASQAHRIRAKYERCTMRPDCVRFETPNEIEQYERDSGPSVPLSMGTRYQLVGALGSRFDTKPIWPNVLRRVNYTLREQTKSANPNEPMGFTRQDAVRLKPYTDVRGPNIAVMANTRLRACNTKWIRRPPIQADF
jgi:hypothetical protein